MEAPEPDPVDGEATPEVGAVVLVGVGHVFDLRAPLRDLIRRRRPDAVLVELDERRYAALTRTEPAETGGGLYGILARFQERAAESLGTQPGEEMLVAVEAAQAIGARAGLIDMDAQVVFTRMWNAMTFTEKLKFLWAALSSLVVSDDRIEDEIDELRGDYSDLMEAFAVQFPSAKEVLIDDRDEVMAARVRHQAEQGDRVVAVVGDGHVEGMADRLEDLDLEVVRLRELLDDASPDEAGGDGNASVGFSVEPGGGPP